MPLPSSCPDYPARPADFSRRQLEALRVLFAASNCYCSFKQLARGIDVKLASKFAHDATDLDYASGGPQIRAVFSGVYAFLKREASDALRLNLDQPITRVYMPARAELFEDYSRHLQALYHVPDVVDADDQRRLEGIWFAYRYGEMIAGAPTIVKSVIMIEAKRTIDHSYLFFKLIYRPTYDPSLDDWTGESETGDDKRNRVHGVVILKRKHMYFLGRDRMGNVPYLIVADQPDGRPDHIHSLFIRSATGGLAMASKLLFVRQPVGAGDLKTAFRSLYSRIGVFPAAHIVKTDRLERHLWAIDNSVGPEHDTTVMWQATRSVLRNRSGEPIKRPSSTTGSRPVGVPHSADNGELQTSSEQP